MTTEPSPSAAPLPENLALLDKAVFNQQVATILRLARERTSDIRKLSPHQYLEATVQINQELFAGFIGQLMTVSGWVQQYTKNGAEYVYIEDHKLQCAGCLIVANKPDPEIALGGLGVTPEGATAQYIVPLDVLIQFPQLMDVEQAKAILQLYTPEVLDYLNSIRPVDPNNNCIDSARMIRELADVPINEIPFRRLSNRDLNRVIKAINIHCKVLASLDPYMPYDVTYMGPAFRNEGWVGLEAKGAMYVQSVSLETITDPEGYNSLVMMVRATLLGRSDAQNKDYLLVAKGIQWIQSGRSQIPR